MNGNVDGTVTLSDIYEVAYLLTRGEKYTKIKFEKGRIRFEFSASSYKLLRDFYGDETQISPRAFMHSIKDVKALIYSGRSRTGAKV